MEERKHKETDVDKAEVDNEIGKELARKKFSSVEKQIEILKKENRNSQSQVFKLRKILSNRGDRAEVEAMINPKTNEVILGKDEILRATLEYASFVLQNNIPVADFREHFKNMKI